MAVLDGVTARDVLNWAREQANGEMPPLLPEPKRRAILLPSGEEK